MLKTYLSLAFRSLFKEKTFSAISIVGLAAGLAISIIIIQFVMHEWSYDSFHTNEKHIYRILAVNSKDGSNGIHIFSAKLGPQLAKDNPEIAAVVRIQKDRSAIFKNPEKPGNVNMEPGGLYVDPSFLKVFSFPLKYGNIENALSKPFGMVISENLAKKYFGETDPIGKTISYNAEHLFEITGVTANVPTNSTITFDYLIPTATFQKIDPQNFDFLPNFETYLLINNPSAIRKIERNIKPVNKLIQSVFYNEADGYRLEPLSELRFDGSPTTSGHVSKKVIYIFSGIAGLILLLALFNYINLATARATIRAKEVGVRKSVGANRFNLIKQFFTESALVTVLAFLLSGVLVLLSREKFNQFFGLQIDDAFLLSDQFAMVMLALLVIIAFLSGIYPALVISRFSPVKVLRGNYFGKNQGVALRRTFMVFQFTVSATLILCSLVIWQQTTYMSKKDLGFNKDQVVNLRLGSNISEKSESFRQDIAALAGVENASLSNTAFFESYSMSKYKTRPNGQPMDLITFEADDHFVGNLGLQWIIAPSPGALANNKDFYLTVNETAVKGMGYTNENIVGTTLYYEQGQVYGTVAGVIRNFDLYGPQIKMASMLFMVKKPAASSDGFRFMQVRLHPKDDIAGKLAAFETIFRKYDQDTPFQYSFLEESFQKNFQSHLRISGMMKIFTAIAVLLACLGLLGLITFIGRTRTKEISIRKVMGASVFNIFSMLSKDFILLIALSILISFPLAYYAMNQWLEGFAYRIAIGWPVFAFGGLLSILIALLTISLQGVKAALTNPVEALRAD